MDSPVICERLARVGVIRLNRPDQRNALNDALMNALSAALAEFDSDSTIGAIVLLGGDRFFSAGGDITVSAKMTFREAYGENFITRNWEKIRDVRKPVIAGVAGYALGGGCELAMMCDIVIAADDARFGQPEIRLGIIPGAGGTQRLPRAISKAKAMDMLLTGRTMDAAEAERSGLISRIVPAADLVAETLAVATTIAGMSLPISMAVKECVNQAWESSLSPGLQFERRVFHSLFATTDQKEGMAAFLEKRAPNFKHE